LDGNLLVLYEKDARFEVIQVTPRWCVSNDVPFMCGTTSDIKDMNGVDLGTSGNGNVWRFLKFANGELWLEGSTMLIMYAQEDAGKNKRAVAEENSLKMERNTIYETVELINMKDGSRSAIFAPYLNWYLGMNVAYGMMDNRSVIAVPYGAPDASGNIIRLWKLCDVASGSCKNAPWSESSSYAKKDYEVPFIDKNGDVLLCSYPNALWWVTAESRLQQIAVYDKQYEWAQAVCGHSYCAFPVFDHESYTLQCFDYGVVSDRHYLHINKTNQVLASVVTTNYAYDYGSASNNSGEGAGTGAGGGSDSNNGDDGENNSNSNNNNGVVCQYAVTVSFGLPATKDVYTTSSSFSVC